MIKAESLPHWDLSNVYPSLESEQFRTAIESLKGQIAELEAYCTQYRIGRTESGLSPLETSLLKEIADEYITRMNSLLRLLSTISAFVASFVTTDSYNASAKRAESEFEIIQTRVKKIDVLFHGWTRSLGEGLSNILALPGPSKEHSFYLKEVLEQSRYLMSEPEESLAADLELSGGNAWSKLQGTICSQLSVEFELNGKKEKMPITSILNLSHHKDPDVRRRAYTAELEAWKTVREPLAAALNGVKGTVVTLSKRRGRVDALHASLDQARIDRETLTTLIETMQESFPSFRRYLKAKAKRMGCNALPWWDLFAPVGTVDHHYSWDETREFIVEQFGTFSGRLAKLTERAFQHNWIDAEPRDGKRGGAFCMEVPAVDESRVLCNFDGSLDAVSTVAHELGHAYHNECQVGKTVLQTRTPMTLAETASIFCETIVSDAVLANASSSDEKLAVLESSLMSSTQVIVDITSRFLFEKQVFERREKSELSADEFCEIMIQSQKNTYGDGLDDACLHGYMWTWKPHYYSTTLSFYNFPYAFGLLFGLGLYAIYMTQGASFVSEYESLLASTGEGTPAELASRFAINIKKPDFWKDSLKMIEKRIDQYVAL
ncbi:MAG: M3 family oligoendopeptidase [Candidatus Bathyarchaeia archaeon]|jgi:pepF/M3 family oligoendopeptidase